MSALIESAKTMARIKWPKVGDDTRVTYLGELNKRNRKRITLPNENAESDKVHLSIFVTPRGFQFYMGYSEGLDELIIYVV